MSCGSRLVLQKEHDVNGGPNQNQDLCVGSQVSNIQVQPAPLTNHGADKKKALKDITEDKEEEPMKGNNTMHSERIKTEPAEMTAEDNVNSDEEIQTLI